MTAALVLDEPAWEYRGGICRLLVWRGDAPGESFTLAVLSHDEAGGDGASLDAAMGEMVATLGAAYDELSVVRHTLTAVRHEFADVYLIEDELRFSDNSAEQLAEDLGLAQDDLLALLES